MSRGDRVIANSLYTAKLIVERQHVARERIRVIYRGIDSATFESLIVPPGPVAKLRERWGVGPETKIVLQAARLTGLKGHRRTVEAAAKLARQGALDGAVIVFAGDAPGKAAYRQELIGLIARYGLSRRCYSSALKLSAAPASRRRRWAARSSSAISARCLRRSRMPRATLLASPAGSFRPAIRALLRPGSRSR